MHSASVRRVVAVIRLDFHSRRKACRKSVSAPLQMPAEVDVEVLCDVVIGEARIGGRTAKGMVVVPWLCGPATSSESRIGGKARVAVSFPAKTCPEALKSSRSGTFLPPRERRGGP